MKSAPTNLMINTESSITEHWALSNNQAKQPQHGIIHYKSFRLELKFKGKKLTAKKSHGQKNTHTQHITLRGKQINPVNFNYN